MMKLSARNRIKGKSVGVQKGQTTGHVRIDAGDGVVITAAITDEAVDDLGLRVGDEATAVIHQGVGRDGGEVGRAVRGTPTRRRVTDPLAAAMPAFGGRRGRHGARAPARTAAGAARAEPG